MIILGLVLLLLGYFLVIPILETIGIILLVIGAVLVGARCFWAACRWPRPLVLAGLQRFTHPLLFRIQHQLASMAPHENHRGTSAYRPATRRLYPRAAHHR